MKKIFIDCGANVGQSIENFSKKWPDAKEYDVYSFEAYPNLGDRVLAVAKSLDFNSFTFYPHAVSTEDGIAEFYLAGNNIGSSLESTKGNVSLDNKVNVTAVDLSRWIRETFSKEDYIVLKIDVEGSEFRIIKHLFDTQVINMIDELYVELHQENKVRIAPELREEVGRLLTQNISTKIYTDTNKGLNFM